MRGTSMVAGRSFFALDTTLVVFFLALETGRSVFDLQFDLVLLGVTLLVLIVLPYFLINRRPQPQFISWITGRGVVAVFGIAVGLSFDRIMVNVLPETASLLPMTLLIISAMLSCYVQFYGFMKFRLAK